MLKNPLDPRVRRTRMALQNAMKALAQEQDYETVTISDLTTRAGVNRATFYQHFQGKEDLLSSIIEDLIEVMSEETARFVTEVPDFRYPVAPSFLVALFLRIEQESDFYSSLLGRGGSAFVRDQMLRYLEQLIGTHVTRLPEAVPIAGRLVGVPPTLTARILASGLLGSLTWYLENARYFSAEDAAAWTWNLQGMAPWERRIE